MNQKTEDEKIKRIEKFKKAIENLNEEELEELNNLAIKVLTVNKDNSKKKLKNPKGKGIAFEREVKHFLESKGWFVIRQSASRFPDLVAIRPSKNKFTARVYFIECKCRGKISREERKKLKSLQKYGETLIATYEGKGKNKRIYFTDLYYKEKFIFQK